jgi:hypothetical protein
MVFNELARADGHSDDDEIIPVLANGLIRWKLWTLGRVKSTSCVLEYMYVGCRLLRRVNPVVISCYLFWRQLAQILGDNNAVLNGGIGLLCDNLFRVTSPCCRPDEVMFSIPY